MSFRRTEPKKSKLPCCVFVKTFRAQLKVLGAKVYTDRMVLLNNGSIWAEGNFDELEH